MTSELRRAMVGFTGNGYSPTGLTWAQRAMWNDIAEAAPANEHFNQVIRVPLPGRMSTATVLSGLGSLMARHESLRTRYSLDEFGHPLQRVESKGSQVVEIIDATSNDLAATVEVTVQRFFAKRYDLLSERPLQIGLIRTRRTPAFLVVGMSHMVTDGWGLGVLRSEIVDLVASDSKTPLQLIRDGVWQPREQLCYEQSEAMVRRQRESARYLEDQARNFSAMLPDPPRNEPGSPRFRCGRLSSAALAPASGLVSEACMVSPTAAVLAAFSTVLACRAQKDVCHLSVFSANRRSRNVRSVGVYVQKVPISINTSDPSFYATVRAAQKAAIAGYRHAEYPPESRRDEGPRRDEHLFNSIATPAGGLAQGSDHGALRSSLADMLGSAEFSWDRGVEVGATVYLAVRPPDTLIMSADTGHFSDREFREFLQSTMSLLVFGAQGDFDPRLVLGPGPAPEPAGLFD